MRSILVIVFLALGALLTLSANATLWVNRTVFDTDEFVGTVTEVMSDETVQEDLAERLSVRLVEQGDLQTRIQESLPEGLKFLAPVLTITAQDLIERTALRILQSEEVAEIFETALTLVHRQLVYIIEGEGTISFEDDKVILDLRPILQRVAEQLGVDDPDGLLANIDIPEDAGQIVLIDDAPRADAIQDLLSFHNQITLVVIAMALLCFAIAMLFARDRRSAVRNVGVVIVFCGLVAALLLLPIRPIVAGFAQDSAVGEVIFDALVDRFRLQSFFLVLLGLLVVVGASLAGQSGLARAVRLRVRNPKNEPVPDMGAELQASATALRVSGLVIGALLLVVWPEPTDRVYITVLGLLAVYFVALWFATSNSGWATNRRAQLAEAWKPAPGSSEANSWMGRNVMWLRLAGVGIGLIVLAILPGFDFGALVGVVALTLVWLAVLDWLVARAE